MYLVDFFRTMDAVFIAPLVVWFIAMIIKNNYINYLWYFLLYFVSYCIFVASSEIVILMSYNGPDLSRYLAGISSFAWVFSMVALGFGFIHGLTSLFSSKGSREEGVLIHKEAYLINATSFSTTSFRKISSVQIDINTASESELAIFPEIGPVRAMKIRQRTGQGNYFKFFDELAAFIGLSEFERERLQDRVVFSKGKGKIIVEKPPKGRIIDY